MRCGDRRSPCAASERLKPFDWGLYPLFNCRDGSVRLTRLCSFRRSGFRLYGLRREAGLRVDSIEKIIDDHLGDIIRLKIDRRAMYVFADEVVNNRRMQIPRE